MVSIYLDFLTSHNIPTIRVHHAGFSAGGMSTSATNGSTDTPQERMTLNTLPYDLLLNVAQHLDLRDIQSVQLVSLCFDPFRQNIDPGPLFSDL